MAVDPLGAAKEAVTKKAASLNGSIFDEEPIRSWVLGLAELKAQHGSLITYDEFELRLLSAAEEAAKPNAKIVINGKTRKVNKTEQETLTKFLAAPPGKRALQTYLRKHHRELYLRVKRSANGRGQGTRPDEA